MLENGKYPTFRVIGKLLQQGFDYEFHEEENIVPEMYGFTSI